jgi:hypothetical protein
MIIVQRDFSVTMEELRNRLRRKPLPLPQLREFKHLTDVFKNEIAARWIEYFVNHEDIQSVRGFPNRPHDWRQK